MPTHATSRAAPSGRGRWWVVLALAAAALATAALLAQLTWALDAPPRTDWLPFATGARVLHSDPGCMYCLGTQASTQAALLGYVPSAGFPKPFVNPPLVAWVLQPLADLPLRTGLLAMLVISLGVLAVAARVADGLLPRAMAWGPRVLFLLAALLSLPAVTAVGLAQWAPLLTLCALGSLVALRARRPWLAGLLLSVLLIKPQTVWLVLPALAAARSWRVLLGVAAGAAGWLLSGLLLVGPSQLLALPRLILQRHVDEASRTVGVPGLVSDLTGSGAAAFTAAAVLGVLAVWAALMFRSRLRADPALAIALGIGASLAFAPHVFADDLMLLAVTAVVWARSSPWAALGGMLALSVAYQVDVWLPLGMAPFTVLAVVGIPTGAALSAWMRGDTAVPSTHSVDESTNPGALRRDGSSLRRGIGAV